ncbi:MAG: M16 family metallopeptidase [Candidatus Odinarchaeota archaeon]
MNVIVQSLPNLRTVTVALVTRHGTSHDKLGGITRVLVPSLARGTAFRSEEEIFTLVNGKGGEFLNIIEKDYTAIGLRVIPRETEMAFKLLFEMLAEPLLQEHIIEIEKMNAIQRIEQVKANPLYRMVIFESEKPVFGDNHPISRPITGFPEEITRITREVVLEHLRTKFLVDPVVIILGNFDENTAEHFKSTVQSLFEEKSLLVTGSPASFPPVEVPPWNIHQAPQEMASNAYLSLNFRVEPDKCSLTMIELVSAIIGGSMGSRMYKLRDQTGLSYVFFSEGKMVGNTGAVKSIMDVGPERLEEGVKALFGIINNLSDEEISNTELYNNQNYLAGKMDMNFDQPFQLLRVIINDLIHGGPRSFEDYYQEITQITPKDLLKWFRGVWKPETISLTAGGKFDREILEKNWEDLHP